MSFPYYVPIHVHTDFSMGDALLDVDDYVNWAKENQYPAIAITDHGNLSASLYFNQVANKAGVKSLIGLEAYCTFRKEFDSEDKDEKRERDHFILLAKNYQGYLDLCWLLGQSMRNSFYYKPIILYEDLVQYNKNLIVSTACMGGRVPKLIMENKEKEAIEFINLMKKTFGDDFYLEIMEVQMADQTAFNQWAIRNYKRLGVKLIWTTDTHYFKPEHVEAHDAMKLINSKSSFQDEGWQKRVYTSRNLWLKKREDIIEEAKVLNYDLDVVNEALDNTVEIEQKIEKVKLTRAPEVIMPKFADNSYEILEKKVMDELVRRGWDKRPGYLERVESELKVIKFKRMEDYFLIVADIVNYAENNDVMCGCGRGCFLPGSKVRLANRELKNIEEITAQEIIISGSQNKREVLETYKYNIEETVIKITLETGETLGNGCTLDHLVTVFETSTKEWKDTPAENVKLGDYLFDVDSGVLVKVQKTEKFLYKGPVYDLNVDIDHTYNINGYAVHNSGAGSLVVCLLGITKIDPIKYGLYFERFLNEKRLDPPDIDLDFDSKTRYKIEIYLKQKYGINSVSHVISFGTFGIKNAIRDVFRVYFGTDKKDCVDSLSKCLENEDNDFDESLKKMVTFEGKWAEDFIQQHKKQFDIARVLVGKIRHYSMHAGGVIIAPDSLEKYIPIMRIGDNIATGYPEGGDTRLMTDAGLMKFDLLGLNACTIINDTLKQIPGLTVSSITENDSDEKVLEQFNKANTFTIFQFEGKNITKFVKRAKPTRFVDLVAINALYRPAVIQAGGLDMYLKNKETYDYEKAKNDPFERVLSDSYGLMCLSEETDISLNYSENEKIKNLKDNQQILSIENFNKAENGSIKKVWNTGKKSCLLVSLSSGTQLVVTKDHRFLTAFGDKQVKDLQLCIKGNGNSGIMGDVLFEKWFISKNNIDFDLMKIYLFGLTIGDGSFDAFTLTFGRFEDAELIKKELEKIYGNEINVNIEKSIRAYHVTTAKKIKNPTIRNPIAQFHIDMYKDENFNYKDLKSDNKFLPKFIFDLKEECRISLLKGLWDSDGCYINYSYKSISKRLIKDIAKLLSSLKIAHYVREQYIYVIDVKRFMSFIVKPFLVTKILKEVDNFVPVLRPVFNRILSERRNNTEVPKIKTKRRSNYRHRSNSLASLIRFYKSKKLINTKFFREIYEDTYKETYLGDTRPVFIESIEDFGEVNCYDIEMQNYNKPYYFANNIISHNCFQESSMRVFQELGGFTLAEADESRHVFKLLFKGKTDHTDFDHMMAKFRAGCHKNTDYDDKKIEEIMETMKAFSKYSFNKSHACAYAMMAYIMMYLRTYHPTQYFASLLSNTDNAESTQDGKKINLFQHYAMTIQKEYGIKIHKPDVNTSGADFFRIAEDGGLLYALGHIKDVGIKAAVNIQENQPFTSFKDFLSRVTRRIVNKRVIKALIYAEALRFGDTQEVFEKEFKEKIDETNFLQKQFAHTGLIVSKDLKEATDKEYSLKGVEKAASEGKFLSKKEAIPIIVFLSKLRRMAGNSKKTGRPYIMYFATLYDGSATINDCILNDSEKLGLEEGDLVKGKLYFSEAKNKKYSEYSFYLGDIQKIHNTEKYDGFGKYQVKQEEVEVLPQQEDINQPILEEKLETSEPKEIVVEPVEVKIEQKPKMISRKRLIIEQIEMPLEIKQTQPELKQEILENKPKFISRKKIKTEQLELNLETEKKEIIIENKPRFISRKKVEMENN